VEIFIDTANLQEIKDVSQWGLIDGVTTNPSLIAKTGQSTDQVVKEICEIINGPISAEVISTDVEGMLSEARVFSKIHKNIVIKLPLTQEGLITCSKLSAENIKTNVTLCFSSNQALLAAKCGATYISPFIGRLDDIGQCGMTLIHEIRNVFDNYNYETKILAASIRHPDHVRMCSLAGADVGTIPFKVLNQLFKHPLTDKGLEQFLADAKK
jgi:transaldolase